MNQTSESSTSDPLEESENSDSSNSNNTTAAIWISLAVAFAIGLVVLGVLLYKRRKYQQHLHFVSHVPYDPPPHLMTDRSRSHNQFLQADPQNDSISIGSNRSDRSLSHRQVDDSVSNSYYSNDVSAKPSLRTMELSTIDELPVSADPPETIDLKTEKDSKESKDAEDELVFDDDPII